MKRGDKFIINTHSFAFRVFTVARIDFYIYTKCSRRISSHWCVPYEPTIGPETWVLYCGDRSVKVRAPVGATPKEIVAPFHPPRCRIKAGATPAKFKATSAVGEIVALNTTKVRHAPVRKKKGRQLHSAFAGRH